MTVGSWWGCTRVPSIFLSSMDIAESCFQHDSDLGASVLGSPSCAGGSHSRSLPTGAVLSGRTDPTLSGLWLYSVSEKRKLRSCHRNFPVQEGLLSRKWYPAVFHLLT